MAINDTTELAVVGKVGGQDHVHTLHFRYAEVGSTEQNLIDRWQAGCMPSYKALFRTYDNPVNEIRARQVCGAVPLRAPVIEAEALPAGTRAAPSSGAEAAPSWLAMMVRERGSLAGRSRQGRFYVGGLVEYDFIGNDLATGGAPDPLYVLMLAYVNALTAIFITAGGNPEGHQLVVHSRTLADLIPPLQCQESSTVVSGLQRTIPVSSQRSRRPGSGF